MLVSQIIFYVLSGLSIIILSIYCIFRYDPKGENKSFKKDLYNILDGINFKQAVNIIFRIDFYYDEKTKEQRFIFEFHLGRFWYTLFGSLFLCYLIGTFIGKLIIWLL